MAGPWVLMTKELTRGVEDEGRRTGVEDGG